MLNAERISTHGGSVRYYIQKKGARKISKKLSKILNYEKKIQITKVRTIRNFAKKCIQSKEKILQTLKKLNKKKIKVYGYGATSKSTTIINFCNLKSNLIKGIFDTSPTKIGKYAPGTEIKIINYKKFNQIKPKVCFLFAWNHYKEIFEKEKNNKIKWLCHVNKKFFSYKYRSKFV